MRDPGDENDACCDWLDVFDRIEFEDWTSGTGQHLRVHAKGRCHGTACPIHHPTDHPLRDWPTHFRSDRGIMERICPHGVGHPDPDDPTDDRTHGCDGCCRKSVTPVEDEATS